MEPELFLLLSCYSWAKEGPNTAPGTLSWPGLPPCWRVVYDVLVSGWLSPRLACCRRSCCVSFIFAFVSPLFCYCLCFFFLCICSFVLWCDILFLYIFCFVFNFFLSASSTLIPYWEPSLEVQFWSYFSLYVSLFFLYLSNYIWFINVTLLVYFLHYLLVISFYKSTSAFIFLFIYSLQTNKRRYWILCVEAKMWDVSYQRKFMSCLIYIIPFHTFLTFNP